MNTDQVPLPDESTQPVRRGGIDADGLPNLPPLPVSEMSREDVDALSYLFCGNIAFADFAALLVYYTAQEPGKRGLRELWDEVGELGYC